MLLSLQANTPATSNAARYARIVEDHALLRRLIGVAAEISELGYSLPDDVVKTLDEAETMVYDLSENRITDSTAELRDLLPETLSRIEMLYDRGDAITGTATGFADLDELTSGMQPEALIVVGARPAMGKTSFALGMAAHAAMHANKPVLYFSLEMSRLELSQRLLSSEARVDSRRMSSGRLEDSDWTKITGAVGRLAEAPLWLDDNPNVSIAEIRGKARRLSSKVGELGLVLVDYVQLMTGRTNGRTARSRWPRSAVASRSWHVSCTVRSLRSPS